MNILMVLDHEFPSDTRVENEALALIAAGHNVHLACFTQKALPEKDNHRGIAIHRIRIPKLTYKMSVAALTFPAYFRFWEKFLEPIAKTNSIDILHIHDLPLARVGARLKRRLGVKLVVDLHENWPAFLRVSTHTQTLLGRILSPNSLWVEYEKQVLKLADAVIVVVDEAKERIESLGMDAKRVNVVSNTLNRAEFGTPDLAPNPDFYTIYYAGGVNYHRGLQTVVEALTIVRAQVPNIRFVVAGSGSYKANLERLVEKLSLSNHVQFLGHLSLKEVAKNLAIANAALIPHLKTDHTDSTIPHKLFQYMYINKPIIASNCLPIERIVKETKSGVIFKSGSHTDLAQKIVSLARNEVEILPARQWVEQKYCWENDSQVLLNLYSKL